VPPVALCDANALYPAPVRDLLMWLGVNGIIGLRWTERIMAEWVDNLLENRPDLDRDRLTRTCSEMNRAIPDALVSGYESVVETLTLPDADDRHVLAAAITAGADVLLTWNRRDFPATQLPRRMRVVSPDEFLDELFEVDALRVLSSMSDHRRSLRRPAKSAEEYLATLAANGLSRLVKRVRPMADEL